VVYSHMQACGLVNDHLVTCYRHRKVQRQRRRQRGGTPGR